MELKPQAERINWPMFAGLIVWLIGIGAMGFSSTAYFVFSVAAVTLFACQWLLNVRLRRAKHGS